MRLLEEQLGRHDYKPSENPQGKKATTVFLDQIHLLLTNGPSDKCVMYKTFFFSSEFDKTFGDVVVYLFVKQLH